MVDAVGAVAQSESSKAKATLAGDMDSFLLLLTTQLKNQDPLSPLEPTEFTNQLVNFASVEQQIATNSNMEELLKVQNNALATSVVGFIGTEVLTENTGKVPLQNSSAKFQYTLNNNASTVVMTITNEAGRVVFTKPGETSSGTHEIAWDGKDTAGRQMPDGIYNVSITPIALPGSTIDHTSKIKAKITGVSMNNGTTTMEADGLPIPLEKIETVRQSK